MRQDDLWEMFAQTGEPVAYMLFRSARNSNPVEGMTCSSTQQSKDL